MATTPSVIGTQNKKGQTFTDPWKMLHEAPRTPSFFTGSEVIKEAVRRAFCRLVMLRMHKLGIEVDVVVA